MLKCKICDGKLKFKTFQDMDVLKVYDYKCMKCKTVFSEFVNPFLQRTIKTNIECERPALMMEHKDGEVFKLIGVNKMMKLVQVKHIKTDITLSIAFSNYISEFNPLSTMIICK